jgi:hypothetical protein
MARHLVCAVIKNPRTISPTAYPKVIHKILWIS